MAVDTPPIAQRRYFVPRDLLGERPEAGELLVHVLAQLPDSVLLDLPSDLLERNRLEFLAASYGISNRIRFVEEADASSPSGTLPLDDLLRQGSSFGEIVEALTDSGDPPASIRLDDLIFTSHRVALVTNFPAHYRIPLFAAMAKRLDQAGAAFRVYFMGRAAGSRPWLVPASPLPFDHEFVTSLELPIRTRRPLVPLNLERRLASFAPSLLLVGGFSPLVASRVAGFATRHQIPWGLWSGEISSTAASRNRFRQRQRSLLARNASFAVAYGHASAEYLRTLRRDLPVVYGRNTAPVAEARSEPVADNGVHVVVVGDLASPRKGVDVAIEALRLTPKLDCRLSVIGGGKLMSDLTVRIESDSRIRFLGPLEPERVRDIYRSSEIMLFPTRSDVFGLVLVEAMGAGLATVVSSAAGAVPDLAVDGLNSLVVEGHDPRAWNRALVRLVEEAGLRRALGARARVTIDSRWTIEHAADAMLAGLRLGSLQSTGREV